jgi:hypothetical protein
MSEKKVPDQVELREERIWIPSNWDSIRDVDPAGEYIPYRYKFDSRLDTLIVQAETPVDALRQWRGQANILKSSGVHLVPGPIQVILDLPVRQVYIHGDAIYRIEADGHVTTQLV